MATSPLLFNGLVGLFGRVHGDGLAEAQIQTLLLTNPATNACAWAVGFHTALARKEGLDPVEVDAIGAGRQPKESMLGALSTVARRQIEKLGRIDDQGRKRFLAAGLARIVCSKSSRRSRPRQSQTIPATSPTLRWRRRSRGMPGTAEKGQFAE
jgi:alkylhydroperoxidase family enzyme